MKLALLTLAITLASCASDPYLAATIKCVDQATTRAEADACRAKLIDAGILTIAKEAGHDSGH
jgi:hypothetical protein